MNATRTLCNSLTTPGRCIPAWKPRLVSTLLLALALGAATCSGVSAQSRIAASLSPASPVQPENGEQNGHVFLRDVSGMVDVTSTLYTANNQTYAVLHGQSVAIVVNSSTGNVCDVNGNVIGYVALTPQ